MPLVTVLSPHRDDAVFSLYLSILHWSECGVTVRVVNFFTRSNYGPRLGTGEHAFVTESRCREDRYALATVPSGRVVETSCHLADAPLRPPIIFNSVCRPETAALLTSDFIDDLSVVIKNYLSKGLVLAPLAIGDHVDHVAIRTAALAVGTGRRLGFYEDLPYATWTSETCVQQRVAYVESASGTRLTTYIIRRPADVQAKRRAAARYRSQISPEEARTIARHAYKYRGGERFWLPANSKYLALC